MTRDGIIAQKDRLEAAAAEKGWHVDFAIAEGADESQLARCEASIGVPLPAAYRTTLAQWNGCDIEIYETHEGQKTSYHGLFSVANLDAISMWTRTVRHNIAVAMEGSHVAEAVGKTMSQIAVITFHDDFAVFVTCDGSDGSNVRLIDMEYAVGEFPPEMPVIASSTDEYLEKCFNQLVETLETEIYW